MKKEKSIRSQLIFYMGIFVVFPLCMGLLLLNIYLQSVNNKRVNEYYSSAIQQIKGNADQVIEMVNYTTSMAMINKDILENLQIIADQESEYSTHLARKAILNYILELESTVLNAVSGKIAILTDEGYLISSGNISKTRVEYRDEQWYQRVLDNGRKSIFVPELCSFFEEMDPYMIKKREKLYIGRTIVNYSGKELGILMIQLSGEKIWGQFTEMLDAEEGGQLFILDSSNKVQMQSDSENSAESFAWEEVISTLNLKKNKVQIAALHNDLTGMGILLESMGSKLIYTIPVDIVGRESSGIMTGILIMIFMLISFTVFTLIYFSGRISKPLMNVAESLNQNQDAIMNLEQPDNSFLEIQRFISSYNKAGERIGELIERVKAESQLKERARYEMLMSQISPHFIFNTVNSIRIMAREEKSMQTEKALESLGKILRAVYDGSEGMTTVGRETAVLQAYVNIMQMRFGNTFQYYNDIPVELFYCEIPAFTVQPIVENAILHGVKDMTAGQVIVSAVEYAEDFIISVFDNGIFVEKEVMDQLLHSPDNNNKRCYTGIGLYNVDSRLKMLYGETYGLIFNEKVRNGFEIWIRIPKKRVQD